MQKRTSTSKAKLDVVQNAFRVVQESVSEGTAPANVTRSMVSQVMAQMGRKGGQIGGKRRLETMTPERRKEVASAAARARWAKPAKKRKK